MFPFLHLMMLEMLILAKKELPNSDQKALTGTWGCPWMTRAVAVNSWCCFWGQPVPFFSQVAQLFPALCLGRNLFLASASWDVVDTLRLGSILSALSSFQNVPVLIWQNSIHTFPFSPSSLQAPALFLGSEICRLIKKSLIKYTFTSTLYLSPLSFVSLF